MLLEVMEGNVSEGTKWEINSNQNLDCDIFKIFFYYYYFCFNPLSSSAAHRPSSLSPCFV